MANLNLNLTVSSDGLLMADVYVLSAISPDSHEREILGVFTTRDAAKSKSDVWIKFLDYTEPFIECQTLQLN